MWNPVLAKETGASEEVFASLVMVIGEKKNLPGSFSLPTLSILLALWAVSELQKATGLRGRVAGEREAAGP